MSRPATWSAHSRMLRDASTVIEPAVAVWRPSITMSAVVVVLPVRLMSRAARTCRLVRSLSIGWLSALAGVANRSEPWTSTSRPAVSWASVRRGPSSSHTPPTPSLSVSASITRSDVAPLAETVARMITSRRADRLMLVPAIRSAPMIVSWRPAVDRDVAGPQHGRGVHRGPRDRQQAPAAAGAGQRGRGRHRQVAPQRIGQ